jgi:two-component system response regulator AtoC
MRALILVIDDDATLGSNVVELLVEEGFEVAFAQNGKDGVALARARIPDLIVCDIMMAGIDGHQVLESVREHPATAAIPFIFLTARAERADVRAGMNLGADDYVTKPFLLSELLDAVKSRLSRVATVRARSAAVAESVQTERRAPAPAPGTVIVNPAMRSLYADLERVAASNIGVLLLGETGVGKEIVARAVHQYSARSTRPFLPINCAALSETLLEAELFGHEKGAFTGATAARPGLFESAQGGTVLLDEIGELPLSVQSKLLRVIEDHKVLRVGGRTERPVDVRFVAATNRDLLAEVKRKAFREDLFYRLNGVSLLIPPLRARRDEILPLCRMFIARACAEHGRDSRLELSDPAREALERHDWPGNVRELRNVIERGVVLCAGDVLSVEHLPPELRAASGSQRPDAPADAKAQLQEEIRELDRQRIREALAHCGGSQTLAARHLGVSRRTLLNWLDDLDLPRPRKRS